ncbi:MAG: Tad domain-containing protein [Candidatus Aureabacteria bacterium]|nr:Tad domain-containing protein [Candidatus Auribacterota bacterium]
MSSISIRKAFKRLNSEDGGQVFVLFLAVATILIMMIGMVYNVGNAVGEKMKLQNLADVSAYSQAVWEARSYNYFAYTNRAMIAHFCTIAFATAVDSSEQLWGDIETVIGWVPYIGPVIKGIHQFYKIADQILNETIDISKRIKDIWNPIYQTTQTCLFTSMRLSLLMSDIPDDLVRTTENANFQDYTLDNFDKHTIEINGLVEAQDIPGAGIMNKINSFINKFGGLGLTSSQISVVGFINQDNYADIVKTDGLLKFGKDFNKLKSVISSSMDTFGHGSDGPGDDKNFPRHLMLYIPPSWMGKIPYISQRMGFMGHYKIKTNEIYQEDSLRIQTWRNTWKSWKFKWRGAVWKRTAKFKYDLDDFRYPHMDATGNISGDPARRNVWTILKQPKSAIQTFPVMLGLDGPQDIYAMSRAEVYYKNPANPDEKATLFNAYWHAKLGPVYEDTVKYNTYEKLLLKYMSLNGYLGGGLFNFDPSDKMKVYH